MMLLFKQIIVELELILSDKKLQVQKLKSTKLTLIVVVSLMTLLDE